MKPIPLTVESLAQLDNGFAGGMIDRALAEAAKDLDDRPREPKAREVTIKVTLTPMKDGSRAEAVVGVSLKLPGYQTAGTTLRVREGKEGTVNLLFQPHNREEPDQQTFLDEDTGEIHE